MTIIINARGNTAATRSSHVSQRSFQHRFWLLLLLLLFLWLTCSLPTATAGTIGGTISSGVGGIPGTRQTINGYDTDAGTDAICWTSRALDKILVAESTQEALARLTFPNPLVPNFIVSTDGVTLLRACPVGHNITGTAPQPTALVTAEGLRNLADDNVLRTGNFYNYTVQFSINLTSLGTSELISQVSTSSTTSTSLPRPPPFVVAVQVLLCVTGVAGFCSPFVHEQANERELIDDRKQQLHSEYGDIHGGSHVHSPYVLVELPVSEGPVYERTVDVPTIVNEPGEYYVIAAVHLFYEPNDYNNNNITATAVPNNNNDNVNNNSTASIVAKTATLHRLDMANALDRSSRLLTYHPAPKIYGVPLAVRWFSTIMIGLASIVLVACLVELYRLRKHEVMQLAQGHWLGVATLAALGATWSLLVVPPERDIYCQVGTPLVLLFLQLLYATVVGRIWRIHVLVSPLLKHSLQRVESQSLSNSNRPGWLHPHIPWIPHSARRQIARRFPHTTTFRRPHLLGDQQQHWLHDRMDTMHDWWSAHTGFLVDRLNAWLHDGWACLGQKAALARRAHPSKKLHRSVTDAALSRLVFWACFPQIVLQTLSLAWKPQHLTVDLNSDDLSEGRYICQASDDGGSAAMVNTRHATSLFLWGIYCLGGLIVLLLCVTHRARNLPSLLNETQRIWDGTLTSGLLVLLGVAIIVVAGDQPRSSPGIQYLVQVAVVLSITLNLTLRMVSPALQVIYRGETILVSQLVQDHVAEQKQRRERRKEHKQRLKEEQEQHHHSRVVHVTGLEPTSRKRKPLHNDAELASGNDNNKHHGHRNNGSDSDSSSCSSMDSEDLDESRNSFQPSSANHYASGAMHERRSSSFVSNSSGFSANSEVSYISYGEPSGLGENHHHHHHKDHHHHHHHHKDHHHHHHHHHHAKGSSDGAAGHVSFATSLVHRVGPLLRFNNRKFTVHENRAPRQRLLFPMVQVQERLTSINKRLLCGFAVSREEWEEVARLTYELGCTFHDQVQFAWKTPAPQPINNTPANMPPATNTLATNTYWNDIPEEDEGLSSRSTVPSKKSFDTKEAAPKVTFSPSIEVDVRDLEDIVETDEKGDSSAPDMTESPSATPDDQTDEMEIAFVDITGVQTEEDEEEDAELHAEADANDIAGVQMGTDTNDIAGLEIVQDTNDIAGGQIGKDVESGEGQMGKDVESP